MAAATGRKAGEGVAVGGKESLRLWLRLLGCSGLVENELARRLRETHGISLARFDFLAQLYRAGESRLTMGELGRSLMVTGGNITGLTARLETEGWVSRAPHPSDRRSQVIALTPKGRRAFEKIAAEHEGWVGDIFAGFPESEKAELARLLGRLKGAFVHEDGKNGQGK